MSIFGDFLDHLGNETSSIKAEEQRAKLTFDAAAIDLMQHMQAWLQSDKAKGSVNYPDLGSLKQGAELFDTFELETDHGTIAFKSKFQPVGSNFIGAIKVIYRDASFWLGLGNAKEWNLVEGGDLSSPERLEHLREEVFLERLIDLVRENQ